jgi:hypothetical protein
VFVTGRDYHGRDQDDYATIAYDADTGAQLWATRYNGSGNVYHHDDVNALAISPDGLTIFVTGGSWGEGAADFDYATVAYDAHTGGQLWVARYNGPGDGNDFGNALGLSADGSRVFVTGESLGNTTDFDYATVAYDAHTGARQWVARYNRPGNGGDAADTLRMSPDGLTVFVTGVSDANNPLPSDYATVAYDANSGVQLWVATYNGPVNGYDSATALGVSPDGSTVFVTGDSGGRASDYATIAYDADTGTQLWVSRAAARGYDTAMALVVSPSGTMVYVTGSSPFQGGDTDFATIAYET